MSSRLQVALGLAFLSGFAALAPSGCSSSHRRDQNFGTNAGSDYQVPDAASFSSQAGTDASTVDAAADTGLEAAPPDASAQESDSGVDS
jgi:hypothetical protein